jgi:hypothetical protein
MTTSPQISSLKSHEMRDDASPASTALSIASKAGEKGDDDADVHRTESSTHRRR